ncbi:MAG: SpoVA/SpoVAEb family sporulation membrane protein [Oscillospiraceae bacterium]|nr:SpoVA/SpoVAEb family sporulation membrane protein [Oscillospiraceae bacterium]
MSVLTQPEGLVTGTAVKMFSVAGPVIVFGTTASVVYGLVLWVMGLL